MLPNLLRAVGVLALVFSLISSFMAYQSLKQSMALIGAPMSGSMFMLAGEGVLRGLVVMVVMFVIAHFIAKREENYQNFRSGRPTPPNQEFRFR